MPAIARCLAVGVVAGLLLLLGPSLTHAQPLGTFSWQFTPYCNVVSLAVVHLGPQQLYSLTGTDDECGGPSPSGVVGIAQINPDGSVGMSLLTVREGTLIQNRITLFLPGASGVWTGDGGTGAFILSPATPTQGSLRPGPATAGTVTSEHLAAGAVTLGKIAPGAVTSQSIGANAVTANHLGPSSVGSSELFGNTDTLIRRGTTTVFGGGGAFDLDSGTSTGGISIAHGFENEGGGFFVNDNTAAIWSPGDSTVNIAGPLPNIGNVLLAIYDEDDMVAGSSPPGNAAFTFSDGALQRFATHTGAFLSSGGVWTNASDRASKTAFEDVEASGILAGVARLKIQEWSYQSEGATRHLGPVAQDFHQAFGLGYDDTTISTIDASGVALVSIQALHAIVQDLEQKTATLEEARQTVRAHGQMLDDLRRRLEALEQMAVGAARIAPLRSEGPFHR